MQAYMYADIDYYLSHPFQSRFYSLCPRFDQGYSQIHQQCGSYLYAYFENRSIYYLVSIYLSFTEIYKNININVYIA